jgi:hypothetical protein
MIPFVKSESREGVIVLRDGSPRTGLRIGDRTADDEENDEVGP